MTIKANNAKLLWAGYEFGHRHKLKDGHLVTELCEDLEEAKWLASFSDESTVVFRSRYVSEWFETLPHESAPDG